MITSTADDHFSFSLPSLSYINTSLEEQSVRFVAPPAPSHGFAEWLARGVATLRAWKAERLALNELSMMSDRELTDVGLNRCDFTRMFVASANEDLMVRGLHD